MAIKSGNWREKHLAGKSEPSLDLNPFRTPARELEIEISHFDSEIKTQTDLLEAWQAFNPIVQQSALEQAQTDIARIDTALKELDREEASLPPKPSNATTIGLAVGAAALVLATGGAALWAGLAIEGVAVGLGGAAALSGAGGAVFSTGSNARKLHNSLTVRRTTLQTNRATTKSQADKIRVQLDRHKTVDPVALNIRLDELKTHRETLTERLVPLAARCALVDERIAPYISQLSELEHELDGLSGRWADADRIARELDEAPTARDRAMLHEKCESQFGEGSPARIRSGLQRKIEERMRTFKKLQKQASEKAALAVLAINRVVLDGSNLCYRFENEFIGLTALRPAVTALLDTGFAVVVIFDKSILIKLKMTRDDIRAALDPRARIHIMASKRSADETLLREAEPEHSAVVSRDRFRDFKDMSVVMEERVFDQNIMESRIEIPALDINVPFS